MVVMTAPGVPVRNSAVRRICGYHCAVIAFFSPPNAACHYPSTENPSLLLESEYISVVILALVLLQPAATVLTVSHELKPPYDHSEYD
jgi:hypothetical protein